jgi:hypothetical protein
MHLYSKLELIGPKIMYRIKKDIPSFEMKVKLNKEDFLQLYYLHPKPLFSTESKTSLYRDAELLLTGKIIENEPEKNNSNRAGDDNLVLNRFKRSIGIFSSLE